MSHDSLNKMLLEQLLARMLYVDYEGYHVDCSSNLTGLGLSNDIVSLHARNNGT